jgi:hypothetical protein
MSHATLVALESLGDWVSAAPSLGASARRLPAFV